MPYRVNAQLGILFNLLSCTTKVEEKFHQKFHRYNFVALMATLIQPIFCVMLLSGIQIRISVAQVYSDIIAFKLLFLYGFKFEYRNF